MPSTTKISKFLSMVLRHSPDAIGLNLDEGGWADITELIEKACKAGKQLTPTLVYKVVATSDKQRFCISPDCRRIRANQGHSIPVELELHEAEPPEILYHGTTQRNITSIRSKGITRGKRNYVHLSVDMVTASTVGARRGQSVVLVVRATDMFRNGCKFFLSENGVWLTEHVPPEYLQLK